MFLFRTPAQRLRLLKLTNNPNNKRDKLSLLGKNFSHLRRNQCLIEELRHD